MVATTCSPAAAVSDSNLVAYDRGVCNGVDRGDYFLRISSKTSSERPTDDKRPRSLNLAQLEALTTLIQPKRATAIGHGSSR
ncbi:hypothetical protein [Novipirellula sp.]|uniref:hypothetical protein n=1 Tax=Novipirellula sp. TaxID=2795430 RepID=UPI003561E7AB